MRDSLRRRLNYFVKSLPLVLLAAPLLLAAQAFQESNGIIDMDGERFLPENPHEKAEWTFARFHYDLNSQFGSFHFQRWAADYPKSDRQFVVGVRRLTRLHARSTEHVIDAKSDDLYDWPWLYVEDAGGWDMTNEQAARLREYLLRGGFLMVDDSHGDYEWQTLLAGMHMIFPNQPIEELKDQDEIFHVFYDLDDRVQIPGTRYIWGRRRYTPDSAIPEWRAIRDDKGRIMVAICHNSDVGDAWEWADGPQYPEDAASLAYRIGINYIIYGMTH
ncbi:MAG TPA: DUF4159 domain-containing protein [Candidatus Acidoferrales bacterium]|nr:DUF4159 domain-containing protein [Candidatus Acidoferrales bacterium]